MVSLLLNATREYGGYLLKNDGIEPFVEIMAYQISLVAAKRMGSSAEDAAAIVPILLQCSSSQTNLYRKLRPSVTTVERFVIKRRYF